MEQWLSDLFTQYKVHTGHNITVMKCNTDTLLSCFTLNPHFKLLRGGKKQYRTATIIIDNTLDYKELRFW